MSRGAHLASSGRGRRPARSLRSGSLVAAGGARTERRERPRTPKVWPLGHGETRWHFRGLRWAVTACSSTEAAGGSGGGAQGGPGAGQGERGPRWARLPAWPRSSISQSLRAKHCPQQEPTQPPRPPAARAPHGAPGRLRRCLSHTEGRHTLARAERALSSSNSHRAPAPLHRIVRLRPVPELFLLS